MADRLYHFNVGNSSIGHIGLCADVIAKSPEQAVEILRKSLPEQIDIHSFTYINAGNGPGGIEYVNVYLNPLAFTAADIDGVDELGHA